MLPRSRACRRSGRLPTSWKTRIRFEATTRINRHDFGVSWQDELPGGGVVTSNAIDLTLDVEAILLDDLERTGAIDYYMRASQVG
jgi:hypothetical protein